MTWIPPDYTPEPESGRMTAGVYPNCILAGFKTAKDPAKLDARFAFIATYKDTDTGNEVVDFIKFGTGRKGGDYYAGLRIERLHALLGLAVPAAGERIAPDALMAAAEGAFFCVELTETTSNNKTYTNIKDVRADADPDLPAGF
jgi:hypothetical protein